ncbi:D-alanyl-D-alanine carboxypeptidase [Pseudenhygromyxa sp. WMMC2535]|uniref:D-alanyl-D-alanine carboxypeptidase/D-alanyl-D-alanine-endopeptidase n=1 Tax=Pseudenhygromyxa sp. WMMC2535 TaxID=2712867 RepID=UPI001C3E0324
MHSDIAELDRQARRRLPAFVFIGVALGVLGLGVHWQHEPRVRTASHGEPELPPQAWSMGYRIVPEQPGPATPEERLEARLAAFARYVERAQASAEPPLVAFGAEALREDIEDIIDDLDDRAQLSVHIRDIASSRVLFDYYGDTLLNPASNHKLLTTSAAIDLLGADFVFETEVLRADDELYLVGGGDPTIDAEALEALVHEVAERVPAGSLRGIVVDDSAFSPQSFGPGYSEDPWGVSYMAPSGALSLNFNTVEISVYPVLGSSRPAVSVEPDSPHVVVSSSVRYGAEQLEVRSRRKVQAGAGSEPPREKVRTEVSVAGKVPKGSRGYRIRRRIVDPGMFTGGAFSLMLAEATQSEPLPVRVGVAPHRYDRVDDVDHGHDHAGELPRLLGHDRELGDVELVALRRSPPLLEVVNGLLTYSNNFTAEQILRTLGWRMTGSPGDWDNGREVVLGYWQALGNDPGDLVFENGSGLSSVGRVTSAGLVDLIAIASRTQARGASLIDALPVAGSAGTVSARLRRSGKRVRAKTGTLVGVSGLTGVITSEAGEPQVAFSILINVRESDRVAAYARRRIEDAIVMTVLDHIDDWEATRGTLILDLEPIDVTREG